MKLCPDCGKPISHWGTRCRKCAWEARRKGLPFKPKPHCIDCGIEISSYTHHSRCRPCALKARTGILTPNQKTGSESKAWKGGRIRSTSGYILIYKPEHHRANPRNKYVPEHILVWEQAHGKMLPDGWIIHHLNGVTDDNRPQNLVGLPNKKHYLVLQAKAKRIQELEALLNNQHQLI